jgi:hypothetical protein
MAEIRSQNCEFRNNAVKDEEGLVMNPLFEPDPKPKPPRESGFEVSRLIWAFPGP